jgi:hypothetical protein
MKAKHVFIRYRRCPVTIHANKKLFTTLAFVAVTTLAASTAASSPAVASTGTEDATRMLQAVAVDEKLAYDVYMTLGDTYDVPQFENIARAEQQHQAAVRVLLDTYDVADPTAGLPVGVFPDEASQGMYDSLVKKGLVSVAAAAQAGVTVEQVDIADLKKNLTVSTPADITRVFQRLLSGSQKHLAAFTALANGDTALHSPNGNGQGQGMGNKPGRGQGQGLGARPSRGQGHGRGSNAGVAECDNPGQSMQGMLDGNGPTHQGDGPGRGNR